MKRTGCKERQKIAALPPANRKHLSPSAYSIIECCKGRFFMPYSIMLDAGHGGADPGAVYDGRLEKDDALELALAVVKSYRRAASTSPIPALPTYTRLLLKRHSLPTGPVSIILSLFTAIPARNPISTRVWRKLCLRQIRNETDHAESHQRRPGRAGLPESGRKSPPRPGGSAPDADAGPSD